VKAFIQRFGAKILGVLHGFDRIRFRGTRRSLADVAGMMSFLWQRQVLLPPSVEPGLLDLLALPTGSNAFRLWFRLCRA
jgi:hypothetical protein